MVRAGDTSLGAALLYGIDTCCALRHIKMAEEQSTAAKEGKPGAPRAKTITVAPLLVHTPICASSRVALRSSTRLPAAGAAGNVCYGEHTGLSALSLWRGKPSLLQS